MAVSWDVVEHATDRLLQAVEDRKLTAMDVRQYFLSMLDVAAGGDRAKLEEIAQTAIRYVMESYTERT